MERASSRRWGLRVVVVLFVGCGGSSGDGEATAFGTSVSAIGSCLRVELTASRSYHPTHEFEATQTLPRAATFILPPTIPVVAGNAGHGELTLRFRAGSGQATTCGYRGGSRFEDPEVAAEVGRGMVYVFSRCNARGTTDASG